MRPYSVFYIGNIMKLMTIHPQNSKLTDYLVSRARRRLVPFFWLLLVATWLGLHMPLARAADSDEVALSKSPIAVQLKQYKVVTDSKGQPKLVDASLVLPGDVVEYQVRYSNRSQAPIAVVATLPVPESVEYVKDSARAPGTIGHTVALKDNQFAPEPLLKTVSVSGGATVKQAVPYGEYRFVRWDLGNLAPGSSTDVSIRAQVAQNLEAPTLTDGKVSAEPGAKK
jgi:uncharacterized repeat protein (TIGR01451 family)